MNVNCNVCGCRRHYHRLLLLIDQNMSQRLLHADYNSQRFHAPHWGQRMSQKNSLLFLCSPFSLSAIVRCSAEIHR